MASATPDLRLPSQPQGITAHWWYQIILLGDRGTCVLTTCPGLHSTAERPGFELATYWSQVQRPNHSATEPHGGGGDWQTIRRTSTLMPVVYTYWQWRRSRNSTRSPAKSTLSPVCIQTRYKVDSSWIIMMIVFVLFLVNVSNARQQRCIYQYTPTEHPIAHPTRSISTWTLPCSSCDSYYAPASRVGALSDDARLTSVCLTSVRRLSVCRVHRAWVENREV